MVIATLVELSRPRTLLILLLLLRHGGPLVIHLLRRLAMLLARLILHLILVLDIPTRLILLLHSHLVAHCIELGTHWLSFVPKQVPIMYNYDNNLNYQTEFFFS